MPSISGQKTTAASSTRASAGSSRLVQRDRRSGGGRAGRGRPAPLARQRQHAAAGQPGLRRSAGRGRITGANGGREVRHPAPYGTGAGSRRGVGEPPVGRGGRAWSTPHLWAGMADGSTRPTHSSGQNRARRCGRRPSMVGFARRCPGRRSPAGRAAARRQEAEAGLRQFEPALAHQQRLQPRPERVQVQHVGRRIGSCSARQLRRAPVRALLLLRRSRRPAVPCRDPSARAGRCRCAPACEAILVQYTGATVTPRSAAARRRRSGRSGTASVIAGIGQQALEVRAGVAMAASSAEICTRCALPSPAESCTRHSRSRCGLSPMVSVSIADDGPSVEAVGQVMPVQADGHGASDIAGNEVAPSDRWLEPRPEVPDGDFPAADGAQERTRTFTTLRPLAPEASASTNSATWA